MFTDYNFCHAKHSTKISIAACPCICYPITKICIGDTGISVLIIRTFFCTSEYPVFYPFIFPITIRIFNLPYYPLINIVIGTIISFVFTLLYHYEFTLSNMPNQYLYTLLSIIILFVTYLFLCDYLLFFNDSLFINNHF